jgi:hypothetical protein
MPTYIRRRSSSSPVRLLLVHGAHAAAQPSVDKRLLIDPGAVAQGEGHAIDRVLILRQSNAAKHSYG